MPADRHSRGLTLIEVMTSIAIASVLMVAATAIFTTIVSQRRQGERLIDIQSSGITSLAQLKGDLSNAGYRWPAPLFAVRVFNNPAALDSGGNLGLVIDQAAGCGTGGLKPGSDVIEIVTGHPGFVPGETQGIQPGTNPITDYRIVLTQFGSGATATVAPFDMVDVANGTQVVMFAADNGEACIGRVTSGPAGATVLNVTMLDRNYNDVPDKLTTYPNCLAGATPARTRVYRLAQRIRYMLCTDTINGVAQTSLFRQVAQPEGVGFGYQAAPVRVQPGVEDLQISTRLYARGAPLTALGNDCYPAPAAGGEAFCFCNERPGSACDLGADPAPTVLTKDSWGAWLTAVRISVSAIGARPMSDGALMAAQLPLKDHVPGTMPDGRRRVQMDLGMAFTNLVQVVP